MHKANEYMRKVSEELTLMSLSLFSYLMRFLHAALVNTFAFPLFYSTVNGENLFVCQIITIFQLMCHLTATRSTLFRFERSLNIYIENRYHEMSRKNLHTRWVIVINALKLDFFFSKFIFLNFLSISFARFIFTWDSWVMKQQGRDTRVIVEFFVE